MATDHRGVMRNLPMKHITLITLTFQNSALILILHYSRIMPLVKGHRYHASTSVFLTEVIKLAISATMALCDMSSTLPPQTPATSLFANLFWAIFTNESWKLAVPAALYTIQNNLQYAAVSNLDPSTFQVTYQLKILTTALFSVILLRRNLSPKKWASLLLLIIGVSIIQLPQSYSQETVIDIQDRDSSLLRRSSDALRHPVIQAVRSLAIKRSGSYEGIHEDRALQHPQMNRSVGLAAVLISCALSGLAGVIFEKILKESNSKSTSLWTRNCQLSFWSLFPSLFLGVMWVDGANIARTGFFAGYNWVVWTAIVFQAAGGIIVSLVVKFADNIAKNFATSISVIVSTVASVYFFAFKIDVSFVVGSSLVMAATYFYSQPESTQSQLFKPIELQHIVNDGSHYFDSRRNPDTSNLSSWHDGISTSSTNTPAIDGKQHVK